MATDKSVATVKPTKEPVRSQPAAKTGGPGPRSGAPTPKDKAVKYLGEVNTELKKTNWPTREELKSQTQVVLGLLVVVGVFIYVWDTLLGQIIRLLLQAMGVRP